MIRAVDRATGAVVALKRPVSVEPADVADFLGGAALLADLRHPCVVAYVGHGVDPELGPFLAVEWIDGEPLSERLRRGPLAADEVVGLGVRLADGLAALHGAGVVHGDVQPGNVMLPGGAVARARLIDLGMARGRRSALAGRAGGTPGYAAPEVLLGAEPGPAADLFSLGALLWACLAGRSPFDGDDEQAASRTVLAEPPSLRGAPGPLVALLGSLLDKAPEARPTAARTRAMLLAHGAAAAPGGQADLAHGRARELAWLDGCAAGGGGRVVRVQGAAGAGKTSLRLAWVARARAAGRRVWETGGQQDAGPFAAVRGLLASAMGPGAPTPARLEALVGAELPPTEAREVASLLGDLWGFPAGEGPALAALARGNPALRSLLIEQSWGSLVKAAAARGDLALVVDDLASCDAPSLRLLEGAVARAGALLVAFSRPQTGPDPLAACRVESLALGGLDDDEARGLVRSLWPAATPAQVRDVVERAGGLPLFLVELAVAGRGETGGDRGSLRGLIEARLAERSALDRWVLKAAALLGHRAPREGLDALLGDRLSGEVLDATLAQLVDAWLLRREPDLGGFSFRHDLLREVMLDGISPGEQEELHGRALRWLRARGEQDALLGWHAERDGDDARAASLYTAASWRSLGFDFPSALRLAERALGRAPPGFDASPARASQGLALGGLGRWVEAGEAAVQAIHQAPTGSLPWGMGTCVRAFSAFEAGRFSEMRQRLDLLCSVDPPDAPTFPVVHATLWRVRTFFALAVQGDAAAAVAAAARSQPSQAHNGLVLALQPRILPGLVALALGEHERSAKILAEAITASERLGVTPDLARVGLAEALLGEGRPDEALLWALQALESPGLDQRRLLRGWAHRVLGAAHLALGDLDEALRNSAAALASIEAPSAERLAALVLHADALRSASLRDEALAVARQAVAALDRDDPATRDSAGARGCLASLLLDRGHRPEARAVLQAALLDLEAMAAPLDDGQRQAFLGRPSARRVLSLARPLALLP